MPTHHTCALCPTIGVPTYPTSSVQAQCQGACWEVRAPQHPGAWGPHLGREVSHRLSLARKDEGEEDEPS